MTDFNSLRANSVYGTRHKLEQLFQKIEDATRCRGWLIFYTHDVQNDHSPYGCSPSFFEAVVKKCSDMGVRTATISDAIDLIEQELL